jgi:hypothetical protein
MVKNNFPLWPNALLLIHFLARASKAGVDRKKGKAMASVTQSE